MGRCRTGMHCPAANSSLEEDCIFNPARIDRIEVVAGLGSGMHGQYWGMSQPDRDVALAEFVADQEAGLAAAMVAAGGLAAAQAQEWAEQVGAPTATSMAPGLPPVLSFPAVVVGGVFCC